MTEVVLVQSSNASSSMQRNNINNHPTRNNNDGLYQHFSSSINNNNHNNNITTTTTTTSLHTEIVEVGSGGERKRRRQQQQGHRHEHEVGVGDVGVEERDYQVELSNFVGLFFTAFRRSVLGCSSCENITTNNNNNNNCCNSENNNKVMEISLPTNVRHVAHVTFDRFNGFLGLPVEFEPEVPRRPPSASTTVFGVSTNSMQLSFDTRGNSVPTILLMMQHRLYALRGLQAEGIFRINPDNAQEEHVRAQLNRGLVPENVDVHCLAGLIKAWFRELPTGVLDCLSPEQVMQSQTEQECTELARLLPPTEFSLLDWAINLMADVAQFEHLNKMNARNVAMVFAPNMTHMADPLTALMHAVQVMNFLKTLIEKTLKTREDSIIETALDSYSRDPTGGNAHYNSLQTIIEENSEPDGEEERGSRALNSSATDRPHVNQDNDDSIENIAPAEDDQSAERTPHDESTKENENVSISATKDSKNYDAKTEQAQHCNTKSSRSGGQTSTTRKVPQKSHGRPVVQVMKSTEKAKGISLISSMNLRSERVEAWR